MSEQSRIRELMPERAVESARNSDSTPSVATESVSMQKAPSYRTHFPLRRPVKEGSASAMDSVDRKSTNPVQAWTKAKELHLVQKISPRQLRGTMDAAGFPIVDDSGEEEEKSTVEEDANSGFSSSEEDLSKINNSVVDLEGPPPVACSSNADQLDRAKEEQERVKAQKKEIAQPELESPVSVFRKVEQEELAGQKPAADEVDHISKSVNEMVCDFDADSDDSWDIQDFS